MVVTSFPPEIVGAILSRATLEDQARCCLVSRSFLPLAREALYHTVILDQSFVKGSSDPNPLSKSPHMIIASLASNTHLASLVRFLYVLSERLDEELEQQTLLILNTCTSILNLVLHFGSYDSQPSLMPSTIQGAITKLGPQLKTFTLVGEGWAPEGTEWLASFPSLKHLQLQYCYLPPRGRSLPLPTFQLAHFGGINTSYSTNDGEDAIKVILGSSQQSLTTLILLDSSGIPNFDLSAFTALRDLTLKCSFGLGHDMQTEGRKLIKLLQGVPNLVALSLPAFRLSRTSAALDLEALDLLRLVTPSLRHLRITWNATNFTYLLKTLADSRYLLSLKSLKLEIDPKELADIETSPAAAGCQRKLEELKAVAGKRGIDLWWKR